MPSWTLHLEQIPVGKVLLVEPTDARSYLGWHSFVSMRPVIDDSSKPALGTRRVHQRRAESGVKGQRARGAAGVILPAWLAVLKRSERLLRPVSSNSELVSWCFGRHDYRATCR